MTNHWIDLRNADVILIMGSNAAENHPISFRWVMEAKARQHYDDEVKMAHGRTDLIAKAEQVLSGELKKIQSERDQATSVGFEAWLAARRA